MDKSNLTNTENQTPVKEKIVYVEKPMKRRGSLIGCRSLGCFFLIALLGLCFFGLYLISAKPTSMWGRTVTFLNNNFEQREYDQTTYEAAKRNFEEQVNRVGTNEVVVTEDELTALGRQNLNQFENLVVDVKDASVEISWILEKSNEQNPLYGIIEIGIEEDKITTKKIGTNRISLPRSVSERVVETFFKTLNFGDEGVDSTILLNELITDKSLNIKEIKFFDDSLIVVLDVSVQVF